jgi:hypothetical protein
LTPAQTVAEQNRTKTAKRAAAVLRSLAPKGRTLTVCYMPFSFGFIDQQYIHP